MFLEKNKNFKVRKLKLLLLFFLVGVAFLIFKKEIHAVSVTSLNVEWFGRGGSMRGAIEDEYRKSYLREFILKHIPRSDVYVFQEIVDVDLFRSYFPEFKCRTHDENKDYLHVVMCTRDFKFIKFKVLEPTRLSRFGLRPVIMGLFKNKLGQKFNVFGVHLKAGVSDTDVRFQQIQMMESELKLNVPGVLIGDFNSFPKAITGLNYSDTQIFARHLWPVGWVEAPLREITFFSRRKNKLDRVYVKNMENTEVQVLGPCKENLKSGQKFHRKTYYEKFISDHCAIRYSGGPKLLVWPEI